MPRLPAKTPPFSANREKSLNLILVHNPLKLSRVDFEVISAQIAKIAPEIRTFIVDPRNSSDVISTEDWRRPTLTVSFGSVGRFVSLRGPILENRVVSKLDQYGRFVECGVETPRSARFTPGMTLDSAAWGPLVILKPLDHNETSVGKNLQVFRTESLSGRTLAADHPAKTRPMLIQSFIDTGSHMRMHRCLTLFGTVLYCNRSTSPRQRPPLDSPDSEIESMSAEPVRSEMTIELYEDPELFAFATRMAAAFPAHPILGCDILREEGTGKLFAIEINGGGNVWHFSSPRNAGSRSFERTQTVKRHFSSFERAADVLARKTREEAR